ncbi:PaaI family thioesterase [Tsuneonella mangrovi]|uniref:PaaI family thioesterase n=1 Tax=Tsuneonella mangrovi TaxID=1982042 RepID=UPI000BA2B523|nr:PaaI family thioesterase [Tsuneonella mangrovi]
MAELLTAYARSLGISVDDDAGETPVLRLEFSHDIEGRPGALHGGATAGLLETAGYAALRTELERRKRVHLLKPINITVEYLSAGLPKTSFAQGRIVRLGRRNANLTVEAWQDDRKRLIATAVMNILMVSEGE